MGKWKDLKIQSTLGAVTISQRLYQSSANKNIAKSAEVINSKDG